MPNRILKESIWTSPNLNALTPLAERYFYRLLPLPDDHGCFEATPLVVLGRVFPLRSEVRESDIKKWNEELKAQGIVRFWVSSDRLYGVFTSWERHQRVRSLHLRKTPQPPPLDDTCRQLTADDGLNPNHNPNPIKKTLAQAQGPVTRLFDKFWTAYPKKRSKGEAEKAWKKISPDEQLLEKMISIIERAKKSEGWIKDRGQFIPYPATWLNSKGWEDEIKEGGGNGSGSYRRGYSGRDSRSAAADEEAERINADWRAAKQRKADGDPNGNAGDDHRTGP